VCRKSANGANFVVTILAVDIGSETARAERTLRSARRSFWVLLVFFILSLALFVATVVDGSALVVIISGGLAAALLVAWSRLAFAIGRLERDIRQYQSGPR
jgi:hypothetical protein